MIKLKINKYKRQKKLPESTQVDLSNSSQKTKITPQQAINFFCKVQFLINLTLKDEIEKKIFN